MKTPRFITFTGADDTTDIDAMCQLYRDYPIEWGLLFSPKRQGQGRYPSLDFIKRLVEAHPMEYAAHLCGDYSRAVLAGQFIDHLDLINHNFARVQVNTTDPVADPYRVALYWNESLIEPILQCRGAFPLGREVSWLFDASGGRGIEPSSWPAAPAHQFVGFAGGLKPTNVGAAMKTLGAIATHFWIDMESGVRDENDRFSVDLCRQVCEVVYGKPGYAK
ncbi:MAG: hypothetical protein GAK35_01045 [Herbaspirillum frisingense]|uniref:Phosphoribosylanthranilate isomerase n=1 Tax=Herbaspirillum frisingense TaxID=92645 RepID=A0A7V8JV40_9BURK|nr:MAG: hypothetical protein GAK35_01045 [Herbaspirillum frisingense]